MFNSRSLTQRRAFSKVYKNFVNGEWVASSATSNIDIINPLNNTEVIGRVPQSTEAEFNAIVQNSVDTFESWKEVSTPAKVRMMLKYQELLKQNEMDISREITREHGKSIIDAKGDIFRGYEVVEHACSFNSLVMGETLENIATNVDIYSFRKPLGVCAGICPFNFPAMIPLWMYPLAITLGNTFVIKPSEKVPGTTDILIDLLEQSGVPKGVVNVVQGGHETVTQICKHKDIRAVSFVGGNQAGEYIYKTASAHGKRAQVNMGAKNHAIVMPDAHKEDAINAIIGACFGSAGQRCMAISVAVMVGESAEWIPEIVEKTKTLSVGSGFDNADITPMNTKAAMERAYSIIEQSEKNGSKILLDGRNVKVSGHENGNWLGPTVIDHAAPGMACYDEEIFAPVMVIVRAGTLDEAIKLINDHHFGNGVAIFTKSGGHARKFQHNIDAGQVGINLPIPVPLPMFSFTGNKASMWGTSNFYGKGAL
jgi:malonate-semialdehyde dehydrogenase (acetylating) / methylmalonate-semialdehyde dehydrogenase